LAAQQPTPLLVTDLRERVVYANAAYERISNKRQAQLLGRSTRDLLEKTASACDWAQIFALVSAGQIRTTTMALVHDDGSVERFSVEASPVRGDDDHVKYVALRLLPYLEETEAAQHVRQAQKMHAIGTLAAGIAHDFNNILYAILGNAELALGDAKRDSHQAESLEEILVAAKRATELVSHILTFSTPSEQERQPLDLGPLLKGVSNFLRSSLPSTIEVQHAVGECGIVVADPSQIHQVLVNLGTNALHAMESAGGTLTLSVAQRQLDALTCASRPPLQPGPHAEIVVKDTGAGMDALTLERAFEPYFSTKERQTGVGLGLAVVYGIVQSHGGSVEIESAVGQGTTVRVLLPIAERKREVKPTQSPQEVTRRLRILFVDDEPAIARMGRRVLERLGHSVKSFESATLALEELSVNPNAFDVLVTDQTMPGMTGLELARRCLELRPDLPIVLSSGFSEDISEQMLRKNRIREFVMKPIVSQELANAIGRAIDPSNDGAAHGEEPHHRP
jgi:signal transduction histidine kinase/ActR/RegA family two-component response regulator